MYDLLTASAVIAVSVGIVLVRIVPFRQRVWIGLALAAGAYCAAVIGLAFIRVGLDSPALLYVRAGSFGTLAILSVIFLVPSCQDWVRRRLRGPGDRQGRAAR